MVQSSNRVDKVCSTSADSWARTGIGSGRSGRPEPTSCHSCCPVAAPAGSGPTPTSSHCVWASLNTAPRRRHGKGSRNSISTPWAGAASGRLHSFSAG